MPTAYMYLIRSDPRFITEAAPAGLGTYEETRNGIATYGAHCPMHCERGLRMPWRRTRK